MATVTTIVSDILELEKVGTKQETVHQLASRIVEQQHIASSAAYKKAVSFLLFANDIRTRVTKSLEDDAREKQKAVATPRLTDTMKPAKDPE